MSTPWQAKTVKHAQKVHWPFLGVNNKFHPGRRKVVSIGEWVARAVLNERMLTDEVKTPDTSGSCHAAKPR